jgi:hypothetical protein
VELHDPLMAATFDTLRAARRLKEAGASEPVAEAIAEVLRDSREFDLSQIVTKADLKSEIAALRAELETKIESVRAELDARIESVKVEILTAKVDILKWILGLLIAQAALIVALVRLFGHP